MTSVYIIANEKAGSSQASNVLKETILYLHEHTISYRIQTTQYARHAFELVQHYTEKYGNYQLLVIGGDGTLHEVVNALQAYHFNVPIGYLPAGTGNDFARGLYNQASITQLLDSFFQNSKIISLPLLSINNIVAINSMGLGIDAQVLQLANKSRLKPALNRLKMGRFVYGTSLLRVLRRLNSFSLVLKKDTTSQKLNNIYLLTVMNNGYFGGGIHFDPSLEITDSVFSVTIIQNLTVPSAVRLIKKLLQKKIKTEKTVTYFQSDKLALTLKEPLPYIQIDGESYLPHLNTQNNHYDFAIVKQQFYTL